MSLFATPDEKGLFFSRLDPEEPLGTHCATAFRLDERDWPTVEHYFLAMQFEDEARQEKIRLARSPGAAGKSARWMFFSRRRRDWKTLRLVFMTRAVYTRCRTHQASAQALLDTGDERLIENSQYDYFWGCGRDKRGENQYGKVLENVRQRLRDEQLGSSNT